MRLVCYQRVMGEPVVIPSVSNHKEITLQNGVAAKRQVSRSFTRIEADTGLKPLARMVDEAYESDWRAAQCRCQFCDTRSRTPKQPPSALNRLFVPVPYPIYALKGVRFALCLPNKATDEQ